MNLQGRVDQVVNSFEDSNITDEVFTPTHNMSKTETEKLQKELEERRAATKITAQQAEEM